MGLFVAVLHHNHFVTSVLKLAIKGDLRLAKEAKTTNGSSTYEAGQPFDTDVVSAWAQGLIEPASLALDGPDVVGNAQIRQAIESMVQEAPDLLRLQESLGPKLPDIGALINRCVFPNEIRLHLTAMRGTAPALFERSMLGAWLGLLLAVELDFDRKDIDVVFRAALLRDLGMLYADAPILASESKVRLNAEGLEEIKRHVEVGSEVVRKSGRSELEPVADVIMAHHERVDGSGYPKGLSGLDFSPEARVVSLVDVVSAIRLRPADISRVVELSDVVSVMLMDRAGFDVSIFDRFVGLVRTVSTESEGAAALARRAQQLFIRTQMLQERVLEIEEKLRPRGVPNISMGEIKDRAERTFDILRRSGIIDKEVSWWLKKVASQRDEATTEQLKEVELQQNEITRQLDRLDMELSNGPDLLTFSDVVNRRAT